jgi:hypothetical protein
MAVERVNVGLDQRQGAAAVIYIAFRAAVAGHTAG